MPRLVLLGSLLGMSDPSARTFFLVCVFFSALLNLFGGFWRVQLDVRDLGGHPDFTLRARAGALSKRIREATFGVASVGAFSLGFVVELGLVRGKYLSAGLHAAEASCLLLVY